MQPSFMMATDAENPRESENLLERKRVDEMNDSELSDYLMDKGGISRTEVEAIQNKHHLNGEAFIDLSEKEVAELTESIGLRHKLLAQITDAREKENNYLKNRTKKHDKSTDETLKNRMTSLQSLVNATAFPQNLALLMATISDGDTKQFYVITLCLLLIAITLQAVLAVMTVVLPSTLSPNASRTTNGKLSIPVIAQRFVIVLLIMVNFVADAFFIAQRETTPESAATSNGSTSMT